MIKRLLFTTFALVFTAMAQTDRLLIENFIPAGTAKIEYTPHMSFKNSGPGRVDMLNVGLFGRLETQFITPDVQWIPSFAYEYTDLNFNRRPFGFVPGSPDLERGLHRITFANFLALQPDDRWLHGLLFAPEIRSSFHNFGRKDLGLTAAIGSAYQFNDDFIFGAGIYGEDLINDPWIIPGPAFHWQPNDYLNVTLLGPNLSITRHLSDDSNFGFETVWNGRRWGIKTLNSNTKLSVRSIRSALVYRHRISGQLWMELAAGLTFNNRYRIESVGGDNFFPGQLGKGKTAPYFRAGLKLASW